MGFLSRKPAKPEAPKGTPKEIIEASNRVIKVEKDRSAGPLNTTVVRNKLKNATFSQTHGTSQPVSSAHLETIVVASMLSEDCDSRHTRSSCSDFASSYGGSSSDYSSSSSCSSSSWGD